MVGVINQIVAKSVLKVSRNQRMTNSQIRVQTDPYFSKVKEKWVLCVFWKVTTHMNHNSLTSRHHDYLKAEMNYENNFLLCYTTTMLINENKLQAETNFPHLCLNLEQLQQNPWMSVTFNRITHNPPTGSERQHVGEFGGWPMITCL